MKKFFRRCDPVPGARGTARLPVVAAVLLAFLAVAGSAFSQEKGIAPPSRGSAAGVRGMLEPGAAAPGFTLKDLSGEPFDFEAEKAKSPILVVFFSMFCEPCRRGLVVAQRLHEKYGDSGWRVVAVALDGEPLKPSVAGFIRQEGYGFRVLVDDLGARDMFKAAELYGVAEIPSTFVIEKGGRIVFGGKGPVVEEELEKFMRPAGKP